jgi:hypothetical protein
MANPVEETTTEQKVDISSVTELGVPEPKPEAPKFDPNVTVFTRRDGVMVEVSDFVVSASEMVSVLRLKEDFEQRGEYLSIKGVMLHILDKGITSTRHYWNASDQNKNRRDFAKSAASLFNADGSIRDAEALAKLAIEKGLVKGSARQV